MLFNIQVHYMQFVFLIRMFFKPFSRPRLFKRPKVHYMNRSSFDEEAKWSRNNHIFTDYLVIKVSLNIFVYYYTLKEHKIRHLIALCICKAHNEMYFA